MQAEPLVNVIDTCVTYIRTVLLEGESQYQDRCILDGYVFIGHGLHKTVHYMLGQGVVDMTCGRYELGVNTKHLCLGYEVVGVHADAVASHQTGTEAQRIPFGVHAIHDFIRVDIHAVKYHS